MSAFSHCQVCRDKLEHTALFCPTCGVSACSWDCYLQHVNGHARDTAAGSRMHVESAASFGETRQCTAG